MAINKQGKEIIILKGKNNNRSDTDSKVLLSKQIMKHNDTLDNNLNEADVDQEVDKFLLHLNNNHENSYAIISSTTQSTKLCFF